MTIECLVSNPLRKQKFHRDYIDLRSHIIKYVQNLSRIHIYIMYMRVCVFVCMCSLVIGWELGAFVVIN